ncbi:MAG: type III pantothenate kinase [Proteobacteria bacterium]|nr:type III pantothenate kinase [Pseudomonadota bacterium]HQR03921.1 type III pantothenate kinase [Rhodocyclaceae bacterium]
MILCIDCGNTRIKWGLIHEDAEHAPRWLAQGALATADAAHLGDTLPAGLKPQRIIGCNVSGEAVAAAVAASLRQPVQWNAAHTTQAGVRNGYEVPEQLGADRWAALIGARALHTGPCLVVNAGTATTIDHLDASGRFCGGLILPGLSLMHRALARNTAQLPHRPGLYQALPRNTTDAIASGALHATLGAMERMFAPLAEDPRALCLISGGAAQDLIAHSSLHGMLVENLVLEGLARIARNNP